jgi:hypothetical protein
MVSAWVEPVPLHVDAFALRSEGFQVLHSFVRCHVVLSPSGAPGVRGNSDPQNRNRSGSKSAIQAFNRSGTKTATRSWVKTTRIKRLFPKTWLSFTALNNHNYRSRREITTSLRTEHRLFLIRSWLTVPSLGQRPMAFAIE